MNENAEPSSIARDSAVAYELSRDASLMWRHYETVQTCERNLAMGQQTGLKHTSSTETDSLAHNDTEERVALEQSENEGEKEEDEMVRDVHVEEKEGRKEEREKEGEREEEEQVMTEEGEKKVKEEEWIEGEKEEDEVKEGEGEGREGGKEQVAVMERTAGEKEERGEMITEKERERGNEKETELMAGVAAESQQTGRSTFENTTEEEISLALASVLPLPESPPPSNSPTSSLASSCFVTPSSTPSRSPSPHPRMSHPHSITPSPRSQQTTNPTGDSIDGPEHLKSPNDARQSSNRGDEPSPKSTDVEVQTDVAVVANSSSQTDILHMKESSTNTEEKAETVDASVQTEGEEREGKRDVGCNTALHIDPELLERVRLAEQLAQVQSELAAGVVERNEARSQQMVAEELARIVQSELVDMRQRNVAETTERIRLENKLGELQVELSSSRKELDEKCQRVLELEDTLKGTSLLVRKLEEQSAASLMSRGGIDYMLQAKLADSRAQEAEQQLEVVQMELLQSQSEVKRLLDRVGEATRDRSEMVSSRVHNQLLQIADERASAAEQKALQLERELLSLREQSEDLGHTLLGKPSAPSLSTYTRPFSHTSTLGGYPSLSSTLPPFTTSYKSPYSLSSLSTLPPSTLPPSTLPPSTFSPSTFSPSTLPPSTSVSLEPFKLTFSLPSSSSSSSTATAAASVPDSGRAALPSSNGVASYSTSTDEDTGLLKPSAVLGRGSDSTKHVSWDTSTATMTSSLSSSPWQRDVTGSKHDMPSLELPSLSLEPTVESRQGPPPPPPPPDSSTGDKDSSSDWSSSDEEEDEDINPLRPSTHSALQAQWEWRAMTEGDSDKYVSPTATGHTPKKKPPPVAPKPRTHSTDYILQEEDPSSFLEPARVSGLNPLSSSFRRPQGPQGRNLPSRFSNYSSQLWLT